MKYKLILLMLIVSVMLVFSSVCAQTEDENATLGWYAVAQWEIDICSKWGGVVDEENPAGGSSSGTMSNYTSANNVIATLQAESMDITTDEYIPAEGNHLYEISWYFQPVAESLPYTVTAYYTDSSSRVVESTSATPFSEFTGYDVEQTNKTMVNVVLVGSDVTINVPVVT